MSISAWSCNRGAALRQTGTGFWNQRNLTLICRFVCYLGQQETESCTCCCKSLANNRSRPIRKITDLVRHRLIEYDDGMPGLERLDASWTRWFQAASVPAVAPQQWVRMPDWASIVALGRSGGGVFVGRTPLVSRYLKDGSLTCPIKEVILSTRAYYLVNRSNAEPSEDAVAFSTWLIDEAAADFESEQQWLATKKVLTLNRNPQALIGVSGLTGARIGKRAVRHRTNSK